MRKSASGRFVLRLPPGVHETLRREAAFLGVSLNSLCQKVLEEHVRGGLRPAVRLGVESPFVEKIREFVGTSLVGIVMFGSMARGDFRASSDVDLLIVLSGDQPVTRELYSRWDEHFGVDKHSPHFVRVPHDAAAAGSLWIEAAVDGLICYDQDGRVSRVLAEIRRMIADGKLSRRLAYGLPYWVRTTGGAAHV
jgi:predicted nucleotidyltransferase